MHKCPQWKGGWGKESMELGEEDGGVCRRAETGQIEQAEWEHL